MTPLGTKLTSPESDRILVIRSPSSSTMPEVPCGCTSIKSPTLYWPSKMIENPAITSRRKLCAPKPMTAAMIVAPAVAGSGLRTKMLSMNSATMIKITYRRAFRIRVMAVSWRFMRATDPASPPQHAGHPVRQHPVGEESEEDHERGGDHVGQEICAEEVVVDPCEEVL